jgi:signal transduction histidine kinase
VQTSGSTSTINQKLLVDAELVRIVIGHIYPSIIASLVSISILSYIYWDVADTRTLIYWIGYVLVVNFAHFLLAWFYKRNPPPVEQAYLWARRFIYGAAIDGAGWGLFALLLMPQGDISHQMFTMLLLAGTVAAVTTTHTPLLRAFVYFSLFVMLPMGVSLVLIGDQLHFTLATVSLIFVIFMLFTASNNHHTITTSLKLNNENTALLESLKQEKLQTDNLNVSLKQEIGQRLNAEFQLRRKEQSLEEAQRIAHLGSWEWSIQQDMVVLSLEMRQLLGLPPSLERLEYSSFLDCIHEDDRTTVDKARCNAIQLSSNYLVEYRIAQSDQPDRLLEEQGVVRLDDAGRSIGLSAIAQDVTQRKEMERLKRDFISVVSHELRTPLTSIAGSLGLIQGGIAGEMSDKAMELVNVAQRNSARLSKLVNDILDVDKLEFGSLPLELQETDLVEVVKDAMQENEGYADKLGVSLSLEQAPQAVQILGDRDRLIQVMTNLLSNAAKYSPKGETVEVRIKTHADTVRVEVSDHGPGIATSFRDKVFQKFCQGDTSDSRYLYGTGLGLNIAKLIVEKHRGRIGFDTKLGQGTTFWFELLTG